MRDRNITHQEYFANNGFSSHHFIEHAKVFLQLLQSSKKITVEFYRYKIILRNTASHKECILKVHWNGKSRHYASVLTERSKELVTFHSSVPPKEMAQCIIGLMLA